MEKKDRKAFGDKLRELRSQKGISIKQLSSELNVNYSYISKLENSHSKPSEDFIIKIAALFNQDPEELMLSAGKIPSDILEILINNPKKAAEFLRKQFSDNEYQKSNNRVHENSRE